MLAETKADAERRRAAAQREVDDLTRQKDSIASHLAQVRQLLGGQVPDMAGAAAALQQPKPISPDPVPASAPRNGASGGAAPTTVQPVQSSATQVSPAATQASRPTNSSANGSTSGGTSGGAPAGAATKQAAGGKEDDEDWWTE
jgi:hypothetical protein